VEVRRRDILAGGIGAFGVAMPTLGRQRTAPYLGDLRVCGLSMPLALGSRRPRFSWQLTGSEGQSHYRITAAYTADNLKREKRLLWDSGRRASAQCYDVGYDGPVLEARQQVWWRVEVWMPDERAVHAESVFETGLVTENDWRGDWLAVEAQDAQLDRAAGLHWLATGAGHLKGTLRGFRTVIEVDQSIQGHLLVSAVELDGVWLNGQRLDVPANEPVAWTTMTSFGLDLKAGVNTIAVSVRRRDQWGVAGSVFAAIIRLPDPNLPRISTAAGWKLGTRLQEGWQQPDFDTHEWVDAPLAKTLPDGEPWPPQPAKLLRKEFRLSAGVRSARLYATALGAYEAWINGRRVSDHQLTPEFSDAARHLFYQAYDVTDQLHIGLNAIGLWVGDGWFASELSTRSRFPFGSAPCRVQAQLEVTLIDGTIVTVVTDGDWTTDASPILASEIYDGEVYDARREQAGWAEPGFSAHGWHAANAITGPIIPVDPQPSPPIRVTQDLHPVAVSEPRPGIHVIDFGQNFAGWVRLTTLGDAGNRVEMRFAEVLGADGLIDQSNLRSALARDIYILKGGGEERWEPRFTYHGFRYVEVRGLPHEPLASTFVGRVVHSDLPVTGQFRIADPVVQRFMTNVAWSQRSNFVGMPTDCPQRDERLGWMGDAQVFWPAAAFNMDIQAYTARVMTDLRRAQSNDGRLPDVVPPLLPGKDTTSPGWADAGVILPHTVWRHYGDTGIIADNWTMMDRYMAWIQAANPDARWARKRGQDFGDWLAVDAVSPGDPTTPKELIASAFWASNATMMAEMAQAIGRSDDAARYRGLFDIIRRAFNADHVRGDGRIGNGSQTGYVLPIRFGLLSDYNRTQAGRHLATDIARRGDRLSTGFLGTPHILEALAMAGQEEVAITLLLQRHYPSWGYMIEKGATTMWERWNSDRGDLAMNSFNHYAFGAIGAFLYRRIAGIDPIEPGFRRVRIAPVFDHRLAGAGADHRTVMGPLSVDWGRTGRTIRMVISLPCNVIGEVMLPSAAIAITHQKRPLPDGRYGPTIIKGGAHTFDITL